MKRYLTSLFCSIIAVSQLGACAPAPPTTPSPKVVPTAASGPSAAPVAHIPVPVAEPAEALLANLTGIWRGGSGGRYYMRQSGDMLIWFGESSAVDPAWAQAAVGQKQPDGSIQMVWIDVPKGASTGLGSLKLALKPGAVLELQARTGPLGETGWTREQAATAPELSESLSPDMAIAPSSFNLTGVWKGDDGGSYYLTQQASRLIWYAEDDAQAPTWSHIAYGEVTGSEIAIKWADLPKGAARGSGLLSLKIEDPDHLVSLSSTGGFGGGKWSRIPN